MEIEGLDTSTILDVGDRVVVRRDLDALTLNYPEEIGGGLSATTMMESRRGETLVVKRVVWGFNDANDDTSGYPRRYIMETEDGEEDSFYWCPSMFERIVESGEELKSPSVESLFAFLEA